MIVVKVGGGSGIDYEKVCRDVAHCWQLGTRMVLVHGGSHATNLLSERLGKPPRFVSSVSGIESRLTDRETLEIFTMAYVGKINKQLVERLQSLGVNAVGLSGLDGALLVGRRKASIRIVEGGKQKVIRDDYTGKVEKVNVGLLSLLLEHGYLPVITPPALSYEGVAINVDADRAAAAVAVAIGAKTLVILSNVPGLLRDVGDPESIVTAIPRDKLKDYMHLALGRMKKKLMAAAEALDGGVSRIVIASSNADRPITSALEGHGTVIE